MMELELDRRDLACGDCGSLSLHGTGRPGRGHRHYVAKGRWQANVARARDFSWACAFPGCDAPLLIASGYSGCRRTFCGAHILGCTFVSVHSPAGFDWIYDALRSCGSSIRKKFPGRDGGGERRRPGEAARQGGPARQPGKAARQGSRGPRMLAGEHLLDRLPRHSHFPRDVGLGETLVDEAADQVTALTGELLRPAGMLQGFSPDLVEAAERILMRRNVLALSHAHSMTTPDCQVNPGLSQRRRGKVVGPAGGGRRDPRAVLQHEDHHVLDRRPARSRSPSRLRPSVIRAAFSG